MKTLQIHVVQRGQSVYRIAQLYGTTVEAIVATNELVNPARIVVGQALVIPIVGSFYAVQPGDSFFRIAQRFGVPVEEIARVNGLNLSDPLPLGIVLYIPPAKREPLEVLLYVEPRAPVSETFLEEVRKRVDSLTYLAMFSYEVRRDGTVKEPPISSIPEIVKNAKVANALVVTNLENYGFSADLAHEIFTNETVQNRLFNELIAIANRVGYRDIHFDFELLFPEDRQLYNQFLRRARDRFHAVGRTISSALAPKSSDVTTGIYGAHDYRAHGEICDFVTLMTYEWGYLYSDPQAVSPIQPVRQVVEFAVSQIPRNKIFLGQNLYGYNWTAPFPSEGGRPAQALSPQQAVNLAIAENVEIFYDTVAQAPYFQYTDANGVFHEVWFEDARSIQAKFNLIKQYRLRGIMYWKLGLAFPQNWVLLKDQFTIRKII